MPDVHRLHETGTNPTSPLARRAVIDGAGIRQDIVVCRNPTLVGIGAFAGLESNGRGGELGRALAVRNWLFENSLDRRDSLRNPGVIQLLLGVASRMGNAMTISETRAVKVFRSTVMPFFGMGRAQFYKRAFRRRG